MSPAKSNPRTPGEQRESFRCSVKGPRRHGRLRIGRREVAVRILDESTGGFAIESDEDPGCQIGDTLLLEIALAWVEVRVANLDRPQPAPEDSQDVVDPPPTRISLRRLRDVEEREANPDDRPLLSWSRIRTGLVPLTPLGRSCKSTVAMIATIVAAGIVIVVLIENVVPLFNAMRSGTDHAGSRPPAGNKRIVLDSVNIESSKPIVAKTPPLVENKTADKSEPDESESTQPPPVPKPRFEVPKKTMRLAHPDFLLKPKVTRLLSLGRNQRDELRRIYEEYRATAGIAPPKPTADGAQDADDPLIRLNHKSLEVLTDEQRQLLTKLHATMESSLNSSTPGKPSTPRDSEPPPSGDPPAGE